MIGNAGKPALIDDPTLVPFRRGAGVGATGRRRVIGITARPPMLSGIGVDCRFGPAAPPRGRGVAGRGAGVEGTTLEGVTGLEPPPPVVGVVMCVSVGVWVVVTGGAVLAAVTGR